MPGMCKNAVQPVQCSTAWKWPSQPWKRIHIDFAAPFMDSMWLIIVDVHSKWPEVLRMSSTTSSKLISTLSEVFSRFGLPMKLVSDNRPQLTSSEFRAFLCNNGIRHSTSAPCHPATNGHAERFVQTFKNAMKAMEPQLPREEKLARFLISYRNTKHTVTGMSPAELMFGETLRTRLDLLHPDLKQSVKSNQKKQVDNKYLKSPNHFSRGTSYGA